MATIAYRRHLGPVFLLFVFCFYFCHRLYGVFFSLDADVIPNLYYRLNQDLMNADYNPFRGYYSSYLPFMGLNNPISTVVSFILRVMFRLNEVALAVYTSLISAVLGLWLLTISVYFFFVSLKISRWGSILGAVICSFTGFHLMGIRLLDGFYLLSFAAVCPVLWAFLKIRQNGPSIFYISISSLFIGVSLWGGSNAPLFYFIPLMLLLPWSAKGSLKKRLQSLLAMLASIVLGALCGAITLVPGITYLSDMNRARMGFIPPGLIEASLSWVDRFLAFFLRGWLVDKHVFSQQTDLFIGSAVFALALHGIISSVQRDSASQTKKKSHVKKYQIADFEVLMLLFLGFGFLMLSYEWIPTLIQKLIAAFYLKLSIRFPHRFIVMLLLPIGYFAAIGFDSAQKRPFKNVVVSFLIFTAFIVYIFLVPRWGALPQEFQVAAALSLGFCVISLILMLVLPIRFSFYSIICIFLMYVFAPLQWTSLEFWATRTPEEFSPNWPNDRFSISSILGFRWRYTDAVARIENALTEVPPFLKDPKTLQGRILGSTKGKVREPTYFAAKSHHQFAFVELFDPATPKRIADFRDHLTEPILDLSNVCFTTQSLPDVDLVPEPRQSCLPQAFSVNGATTFTDDKKSLNWVINASRQDFLETAAIECRDNCPRVPQRGEPSHVKVEMTRIRPDLYELYVEEDKKSLIFLSIPYRFDWIATVNGKATEIYRANYAYMAIPVDPGKSQVVLELKHNIALIAKACSYITITLLLLTCLITRPNGRLLARK